MGELSYCVGVGVCLGWQSGQSSTGETVILHRCETRLLIRALFFFNTHTRPLSSTWTKKPPDFSSFME